MIIPNIQDLNKGTSTSRYIKIHYPEFFDYLTQHFPNIPFIEKMYCYFNNTSPKLCPICGNKCRFISFQKGYAPYCCSKCSNSDPNKKQKTVINNIQKYGVEYPYQLQEYKDKAKQTCLERYGVSSYTQTQEYKEKTKNTSLERYGVEHYNKTQKSKDRHKKTCLKKYGVDSYRKTQEYIEKTKQTKILLYGDENYVNTQKAKQTCLERYGVDNYSKTQEFREKVVNTNIERYGVDNYTKTQEYREKFINTNIERYGVEHYSQTQEYKERSKQTCLEKYGAESYSLTQEYKERAYNTKKKNGTFNTSQIEQQFKKWLDDNKIEYKYQYKSKEYPFVCDFYFPLKDLYLEIQGSWTHGGHPFDPSNEEDIKTLNKWKEKNTKYYDNSILVWTVHDVAKREVGKNLNWIEVFTNDLNDVIECYITH